jgi:uncharacterized protein (TIGR00255 family)
MSEGRDLAEDIAMRIGLLSMYLANIKERRTGFAVNAKARLKERLEEIMVNTPIDETRLIQEVAILVERSDISEEIVRAGSHLKSIEGLISADDPVGKKIDFFIQELRREVNTIGAKASDIEISKDIVEIKHELEKIREQTQNIQ